MVRQILPIFALLLGSAFLLFAGGINGLILPVRGAAEGFSAFSLGLLGTGWAVGYVSGCLATPQMVARVGHIRAFSVMASIAALVILASLIFLDPWAWVPLRAVSGFCFAGAAMIVESWLNERAEPNTRGRIFGTYTMINLVASTGGQMTLTLGDTSGYLFFVLGAMFYCLALIPTAMTSSQTPKPLVSVRLNVRALWRNSPIAFFAVLMTGVSNSAFGTLSAVYANKVGLMLAAIALFASLPVLAGAIAQVPVGIFSDRIDRRKVLIGIALVAMAADVSFLVLQPEDRMVNIALASVFGAAVFSMYPVIVAHASDHAEPGTYIQISGGLLMLYGIGGMVGPLAAGAAMSQIGPQGLFLTTLAAHVPMVLFAMWRISRRAPVAQAAKGAFVPAPMARASTPETMAMAPEDIFEAKGNGGASGAVPADVAAVGGEAEGEPAVKRGDP